MVALAALAAQEVVDMASQQQVTIEATEPSAGELATYAAIIAALLGNGLAMFAGGEALRRNIPETDGAEVARQVDQAIESLTGRGLETQLGGALWSSVQAGRHATIEAADPPAVYYVANEIRDKNTCKSCRRIDGQIFATLELAREAYPNGGYIGCDGGVRCRGTYDPVWGVPPVEPKVPEDAQPYHADLDGIEDLAAMRLAVRAAQAKKTLKTVRLTGGVSSDTELHILPDGRRIVHKKGPKWNDDQDSISQADAEQLSSELSRRLGIPAPRVYRDEPGAVWIEYRYGRTIADLDTRDDTWPGRRERVLDSRSARRAGLVDTLVGDRERNDGNVLVDDDGNVEGIDHGAAWLDRRLGEDAGPRGTSSRFFVEDGEFIANPMTRRDARTIRRVLRDMAASFERLGRGDWLGWTRDMLSQIEDQASGEDDLLEE